MKIKFGKIAVLAAALALALGTVFCLSSCSGVMFDIVDEIMDNVEKPGGSLDEILGNSGSGSKPTVPPSDNDGEIIGGDTGGSTDKPGNTGGSDAKPEDGETAGDDEDLEFYPGQGSVPVDKIDAKNRTLLSTVDIITSFGSSPSAGSGVIYKLDKEKGDAYIITNYHVVYNESYGLATDVKFYLYGMRYETYAVSATIVGGAAYYDIAVLKVTGSEVLKNSYAMAADLGDSEQVRVFDEVFVVGNAEGYGMSVTEGIVSVDSEDLEMTGADGSAIELRVMRTSAAINKGNSGGGIYDANGRLVGIVVAKRTGHEVDNMGYAIPINLARNLAENIIYFCSDGTKTGVQRPLIGITITAKVIGVTIDEETGEVVKSERIEISELSDTCIAKDKVKAGDVINSISVDGVTVKVTRLFHVLDHMLTARVGSEVKMNVTRGEETIEVTFTVPETAFNTMK